MRMTCALVNACSSFTVGVGEMGIGLIRRRNV
ncbi:uncharacterized protein DEA37_0011034 [Paragonimus westermani]|uniref:Uncharacterized protein n=1 Tax=Paragonimus westermani TaxID=34504 RepID=A0A5J4N859_9TREM|nr:uncharacterized protein DEA37_0013653 [Paragonimus westermani]KAA3670957.1 uncharacterized protein DEA37_0013654 [Paragonimus westermani]KAA3671751.1 uncharacterized protein DEA37_0003860 [Paragonimus westermani]KAA3679743.1 uncharacterized protein DEA37_0011034 [Paragonimus westermani]